MNYQVLARKYRPRRFEELIGQEHVQKALKNALDSDRLHHAYLFTGTRGVGKTTIARILSRCLNCEQGISSNPCGVCSTCREIDEGRFVDLIEVDAASRTKVEDTRELLDNVQYAPTRGRYKVYLIDEVHMLSTHSFNALLKTLEEPPPHVKFLLATTDPQKLPVTVLSRCLQFNLKAMTAERIVAHLKDILGRETIASEDAALWELARAAQGSMRDALSLTDQAIAHGNGALTDAEVRAMLGTVDRQYVWQIGEALAAADAKAVLASVDAIAENAPDWSDLLAGLISLLHRVCVAQVVPDSIDDARGDRAVVQSLAERIPAADVQLYYQTALIGRRDLPLAPDARAGLEMTLLRMLAFRPAGTPATAKKPDAPSAAMSGGGAAGRADATRTETAKAVDAARQAATVAAVTAVPAVPASQSTPATRPMASVVPMPARVPVVPPSAEGVREPLRPSFTGAEAVAGDDHDEWVLAGVQADISANDSAARNADAAARSAPIDDTAPGDRLTGQSTAVSSAATSHAMPSGQLVPLSREWASIVARLTELPRDAMALARNCALEAREGGEWELVVAPGSDILLKENITRAIEGAVSAQVGHPVRLRFQLRKMLGESPRMIADRHAKERQSEAERVMHADDNVRDLTEIFAARILPGSIKPVG